MCGFPNRYPNFIQSFEPIVGGCLITYLPPEPFLRIQSWLIRRQIFQAQTFMGFKKNLNLFTSVPSGSVDIKPDSIIFEHPVKMLKTLQKAISIAFRSFYHSTFAQKRRNPAKNIESCAMVAGSGNSHTSSPLCPYSTNPRVQRKSRFVFKYNRLVRFKKIEFFLKRCGISSFLLNAPEYTNNRRASSNTLIGEANTELGEPLFLRQSAVLGEQQGWGHPIEHDLSRVLKDFSLNQPPVSGECSTLTAKDARFWISPLTPLSPARLPCASRDSSFDASNLTLRLSIPDADPPVSAIGQLSLNPSMPPGLPKHKLSDALDLHRDALEIKWDFSCLKTIIGELLCQIIYCVCISIFLNRRG